MYLNYKKSHFTNTHLKQLLPFILVLIFLNQSCIFYNSTKYTNSNVCELHQRKMHKTIVKVTYGLYCSSRNPESYKNAKSNICMGCVVRSPRKYFGIKYYCSKCNKIKRKAKRYLKKNGEF